MSAAENAIVQKLIAACLMFSVEAVLPINRKARKAVNKRFEDALINGVFALADLRGIPADDKRVEKLADQLVERPDEAPKILKEFLAQ